MRPGTGKAGYAIRRPGRRRGDGSLEPGQDAFLDVVANLVGILIILVVLIGSQARAAWERIRVVSDQPSAEMMDLEDKTGVAESAAEKLEEENVELESEIAQQKAAARQHTVDRDRLQLAVAALQQTIAERQQDLSEQERKSMELDSVVENLKAELAQLQGQTNSLDASEPETRTIDHLPTPIAKTVFGEEVHFRLKHGRLVHVPLNELVELMRSEWRVKAKKLTQTSNTIETVGPVHQFRLQYQLVLKEQIQKTDYGVARSLVPGLERFILLPTQENLGEPYQQAWEDGSEFRRRIDSLNPRDVTISIWVYPDSFGYFNQLKSELTSRGFLCAGWPLPENQPISGSPQGLRTAAQ